MQDLIPVVRTTCRIVVWVIPPLLRLGVIDRSGCIVLGAVIGIVVAVRSGDRHALLAARDEPRPRGESPQPDGNGAARIILPISDS